jgi:glycosyltransferase involved in cell wall biosynthesis
LIEQKISVIIPAYNESKDIAANLRAVVAALSPFAPHLELVVVDDGSVDQTWQQAVSACDVQNAEVRVLRYERNQGKGYALACGALRATGDFVVFLDADLDLHPEQVAGFFDVMFRRSADAVIGSKWHPQSVVEYPPWRKILSRGYYGVVQMLFGLPVRDTQTGLKIFRATLLQAVVPRLLAKRFAFDVELLAVAHRMGFRIAEAPVLLRPQRDMPRLRLHDVWFVLVDTLAIFYRIYLRRYYDRIQVTSVPVEVVSEARASSDR